MHVQRPPRDAVLTLPFAEPTGYGLGKAGWVSVRVDPKRSPPLQVLTAWILESYYAVAPKKSAEALLAAAMKKSRKR